MGIFVQTKSRVYWFSYCACVTIFSESENRNLQRHSFIHSFSRAQISSILATLVDWGALFFLVERLHVWYVIAVAAGSLLGAVTNFLLNRYWTFTATHRRLHRQAIRYFFTAIGSMALNTGGVYLLTEFGKVHYSISVISVALLVGWLFNYPIQRLWVFK